MFTLKRVSLPFEKIIIAQNSCRPFFATIALCPAPFCAARGYMLRRTIIVTWRTHLVRAKTNNCIKQLPQSPAVQHGAPTPMQHKPSPPTTAPVSDHDIQALRYDLDLLRAEVRQLRDQLIVQHATAVAGIWNRR
jgi:hypothetical protein